VGERKKSAEGHAKGAASMRCDWPTPLSRKMTARSSHRGTSSLDITTTSGPPACRDGEERYANHQSYISCTCAFARCAHKRIGPLRPLPGTHADNTPTAKSRTIMVRLISMAMTGYYRTMQRPRAHQPLSMLKYDPIGTNTNLRSLPYRTHHRTFPHTFCLHKYTST
jgi:hypothetical protein